VSTSPVRATVPPVTAFKVRTEKYADDTHVKIEWNGMLAFDGDVVVLSGRAPIPGLPSPIYPLFSRTVNKRIPLCEIFNVVPVVTDHACISFDRIKDGARWSGIRLHAANPQEAATIIRLLPTRTTPEFGEESTRHKALATDLQAATPTVFVTPIIIAMNYFVFVVVGFALLGWGVLLVFYPLNPVQMLPWGANYWPITSEHWMRLFNSTFLHFNVIHLVLNMWALGKAGVLTERLFGNRPFAVIYVLGAIASSLAFSWVNPNGIGAGASGAIFAVYGALLAYLAFQADSCPKGAVKSLLKSTLGFVAFNLLCGFTFPGDSNVAHLAGLVVGFLLGAILCRPLDRRSTEETPMPDSTEDGYVLLTLDDEEQERRAGAAVALGGRRKPTRRWVRILAAAGAMFLMVFALIVAAGYRNGHGGSREDAGVGSYREAAAAGDSEAMYNLGVCYANGMGVEQNWYEAVQWYRRAAEAGNTDSLVNLGVMYEKGRGVAKDEMEAVRWYRKAAEAGDSVGMYDLGVMYEKGRGVARNDAEAVKWYQKAAMLGQKDAQEALRNQGLTW